MEVLVHKHGEPYTNYSLNAYHVDLDSFYIGWPTYTITFTAPNRTNMNDARLRFWFRPYAKAGTVYHIDHVVLRPLSPNE